MRWKKPSPQLVRRFEGALPVHPDAQPRKMFGYPACFVKGHFFAGLHEKSFVVRLPNAMKDRLPELAGARIFDPMGTGKGMKDWWVIPASVAGSESKLAKFLAAAFVEVRKLPARASRARAAKTARTRTRAVR